MERTSQPSDLASTAIPLTLHSKTFFRSALLNEWKTSQNESCEYIALSDKKNPFKTDTIVNRQCYKHLLPQIHNHLLDETGYVAAITGSPGIGKSVFGVLLIRHYLQQKLPVLYWERDNVYMFSFDEQAKSYFGLVEFADFDLYGHDSKEKAMCYLYAARWKLDSYNPRWELFFASDFITDMVVIHDPKKDDMRVADEQMNIDRLVYILSHGHSLISHWNSKGGGPDKRFYLPLWSKEEIQGSLSLLKRQDKKGTTITSDQVERLYTRFGGCIRGWLVQDQESFWDELVAKAKEVARNYGDNVLERNTSSRGSVIHMFVEFDRELQPCPFNDKGGVDAMSVEEDRRFNQFDDYKYVFGSDEILNVLDQELVNKSDEAIKLALRSWASVPGFENVYGALYELRCHRIFENNTGNLKLRMRVVYSDDSKNTDQTYQVHFPKLMSTKRFKSNDPSVLEEGTCSFGKGTYLWPWSSNFPTYDSAVVVDGEIFGLPGVVGLLFQMTVSGANGLPRRPKHSVKQHIRQKFHRAFQTQNIPGYKTSYTVFVVPSECFEKFTFQQECIMGGTDDTAASVQPKFQLVFEMEDVFTYKRTSPRGSQDAGLDIAPGSRKRVHRYNQDAPPKKVMKSLPQQPFD